MMREETNEFFRRVFEFSGATPVDSIRIKMPHKNVGIDAYTASFKRFLNPIMAKDYVNGFSIWCTPYTKSAARVCLKMLSLFSTERMRMSAAVRLKDDIAHVVEGYYGSSNLKLQSLTGIDLAKYGYDLGE